MPNIPPATIVSLARDIQQQVLLLTELQAQRAIVQVPRAYLETWYNDLARIIVLALTESH